MSRLVPVAAVAALGGALLLGEPARAWGAYVANLLFWSSLAAGALTLSAAVTVCGGRWAGPLQRLGEGWLPVLGLAAALALALPLGSRALYPWATGPVPAPEGWLVPPVVHARVLGALAILYGVARRYVRAPAASRSAWAVALILTFAVAETLLAADLVMSLEPPWTSTLFGPYFFIGGAYAGTATLAPLAVRRRLQLPPAAYHDLGRLLLGLCLLWTYMLWSQYLVIWYGNLPRETVFWLARSGAHPWKAWGWAVLAASFAAPFVLLLSRELKRRGPPLAAASLLPVVGIWGERYVMVMPAADPEATWPLGAADLTVTISLAALALAARGVWGRRPAPRGPSPGP